MHILVLSRDGSGAVVRQNDEDFHLHFVLCRTPAEADSLKTSSIEWDKCPIQAQIDQPGPSWDRWRTIT